jgi:hypothetical protein
MDKYIKREDLGEAMEAIAMCAMENVGKIHTEISISKGWKENVEIKVVARDASYKTLAESVYTIVDGVRPSEYCDALLAAIDLQENKEQNVESNKEEE